MTARAAWQAIADPEVRAVFQAGAANGRLTFHYATSPTPGGTRYYVFLYRDPDGTPHDAKMTKMQLVAAYGA